MTVTELRQRQATLEAVRLDLSRWRFGKPSGSEKPDDRPVVAIDWSEIFSYLTYTPPRKGDSQNDLFAIHYAGLTYLLFRLPCRLVLLPPYAEEMQHFVDMIRTKALLVKLMEPGVLVSRYSKLLGDVETLRKEHPAFGKILEGDWGAIDELPGEVWTFLEELLREHLPGLFLDVQESTADVTNSLKRLMSATDHDAKRLTSLEALKALPDRVRSRSLGGWQHWLSEMSLQRPKQERQNRADALALAYLQGLHQELLCRDVPVYFASRSVSMLQVMEQHSGEFPPYPIGNDDASRRSRSSWRSWDYFAELGYYSAWTARNGDDDGDPLPDIEQDILQREAKLDKGILKAQHDGTADLDVGLFGDWDTLRGSFDLEGIGGQDHWKRLRNPEEHLLADMLRSVLSAADATTFLDRRGELAKKILGDIESILGNFETPETLLLRESAPPEHVPSPAVAEIAIAYVNIAGAFDDYLRATTKGQRHEVAREAITLLRRMLAPAEQEPVVRTAQELLHLLAAEDAKDALTQAAKDWLIGTALFCARLNSESVTYLASWIATHSSAASPALGLATRALCAEAYRQQRDYEPAMQLLFDVQEEKRASMSPSEALVWHCLKGQLLLVWMEPARENFELFPKPFGRRSENDVIVPMVEPVAAFADEPVEKARGLQVAAANILLYLAGRHIPENVRELAGSTKRETQDEFKRRLGWFLDRRPKFAKVEQWLRHAMAAAPQARPLHTLGYYNWKLYLLTNDEARSKDALRYFDEARRAAEELGDLRIVRLVGEHSKWAAETLRGAR